jgi:hypothetical protein
MGNSEECIKIDKFYQSLEKLMVPLEYLARKCYNLEHQFLYNSKKYRAIYETLTKNDLINQIDNGYKEFEKNLKIILNSKECDINSLFTLFEIKGYLQNILFWKQCCPEYRQKYDKIEKLFIDIQKKYLEFNKNTDNYYQNDIYSNDEEEYKNNNNDEFIYYQNDQEQFQQQVLINKQKVIQAQELTLLNDNFGRALASLECFANRYSGKNISNVFGYYDMFNLGNTQDLNELQKKAFLQTQIFKLAYEEYIRNYGKYDIPENINIEEIKSLLKKWVENVPNEFKIMYQGMFNTISSLNNDIFNQKFESYTEQAKGAKMNPKKIMSFAPSVYFYNQQRCEEAKNQCLEEGKLSSILNINQTYKDDKNAKQLEQQILLNNQLYNEDEEYKDLK